MLAEVLATPASVHALLMGPYFTCADVTGYFSSSTGALASFSVESVYSTYSQRGVGSVDSENIQPSI